MAGLGEDLPNCGASWFWQTLAMLIVLLAIA